MVADREKARLRNPKACEPFSFATRSLRHSSSSSSLIEGAMKPD
jgi:hypothetical protein